MPESSRAGRGLEASMKVPPKRKGNAQNAPNSSPDGGASMKVPPKRKGNAVTAFRGTFLALPQ